MSTNNDGSESVDQFLARIASLKGGRDEAEEEKSRRLEEEFVKNRKERQARRLERARSLSPSKTGPARTIPLNFEASPSADKALNPPVDLSPTRAQGGLSRSNAVRTSPTLEPSIPHLSPKPSPSPESQSSASGLARSGTLSWQQRPRNGDTARPRPLSTFATIRSVPRPSSAEPETKEPTREEIAASLGLKDPTWFRQTQDRGVSSAAYRKNQVEDTPQESVSMKSMRLPGLSREASPLPSDPFVGAKQEQNQPFESSKTDRFKRGDTPDIAALRASMVSPPMLTPQRQDAVATRPIKVEPEEDDYQNNERQSPELASGATRSASPTKGLGGFVESAMMRRSDSVSKRWNVPSSTGLKRGDSVAGTRPPVGIGSVHARGLSRDVNIAKNPSPSSPLSPSRLELNREFNRPATPPKPERVTDQNEGDEGNKAKSQTFDPKSVQPPADEDLPKSPSKTMDPRRWSPTKSSWLESALNAKPEPPKMQPLKDEQPSWMQELQRSKSRAGRDPSPSKVTRNELSDAPSPPDFSRPVSGLATARPKSVHGPSKSISTPAKDTNAPSLSQSKQETPPVTSPGRGLAAKAEANLIKQSANDEEPIQDGLKPTKPSISSAIPGKTIEQPMKRPPVVKPKPQTPPKIDFRSSLKSRTPATDSNNSNEPEFKSVFGKLKPATTQNYVAPDELKHNILKGKAGLNLTDGPQKSKRVDEFKESILAKKEEMKTGPGVPPKKTELREKPEAPIPEALARRKTLSKASAPVLHKDTSGLSKDVTEASAKPQVMPKPKVISTSLEKQPVSGDETLPLRNPAADKSRTTERSAAIRSPSRVQPDKMENTNITASTEKTEKLAEVRMTPVSNVEALKAVSENVVKHETAQKSGIVDSTAQQKPLASNDLSGLPPSSKLASRLNPNLATLISRGNSPRPVSNETFPSDQGAVQSNRPITSSKPTEEPTGANLTHMTKSRAKGPKRRAPKTEATEQPKAHQPVASPKPKITEKAQTFPTASPKPMRTLSGEPKILTPPTRTKATLSPPPQSPTIRFSSTASSATPKSTEIATRQAEQIAPADTNKPKPVVAPKSPLLRQVSNSGQTSSADPPKPSPKPKAFTIASDSASPPTNTRFIPAERTSTVGSHERQMPLSPSTSKVNSPRQPQHEDNQDVKPSTKPVSGLGVHLKPSSTATMKKIEPIKPQSQSTSTQPSTDSDMKVEDLLKQYFPEMPRRESRGDFDTEAFLNNIKTEQERIKTIQNMITEITGDGKKIAMPPQQEHILFEESMYLAVHTFERGPGNKATEVFLWCGDGVSDAAIEDAQVFCKKDARDHNTKLEIIRQGKEPSQFFQALGGIIVTRRNKSSAFYMLCGRRNLGHIAFDEVETLRSNLCSGFTYLISAQFGKLYLWKGKGAGADEVGCARLIGMDLGLTGEIEEIDEGAETKSFWDIFPSKDYSRFSNDWAKRSELEGLPTSLYKVKHEQAKAVGGFWGLRAATTTTNTTPKAVLEHVSPFNQGDVQTPQIHILDAYRSVYILINDKVSADGAEFVSASYIAQEIAMLAPAMQDRPILPVCYVCFGEPPSDVRVTFRKWTSQRESKSSSCVPLEDVMEFLKL